MTAPFDPVDWLMRNAPHLAIDPTDQFQVSAISLLSSIDTGPYNIHGTPLRTVEMDTLVHGDTGPWGPPPSDDETERRLLTAPACPWYVNANLVSIACTNEPGKAFMARVAEWPGHAHIKGVVHVSEIPDFDWDEPGYIGSRLDGIGFAFATTDGRVFAEHPYTEVALWRP